MKSTTEKGGTTLLLISRTSICAAISFCLPAHSQDYKPGDPVTFGAAHKSPFNSSSQAGTPGSSRFIAPSNMVPGTSAPLVPAATLGSPSPSNSAMSGVPDNFLNSRSIEWKPGDPVSFGTHRPYALPDNRSMNTAPAQSIPSMAMPPATASTGGSGTPLQDLAPNPATAGFGGTPAAIQTAAPALFQQPPLDATNLAQKPAKTKTKPKSKPAAHPKQTAAKIPQFAPAADSTNPGSPPSNGDTQGNKNGSSGNFFSHAMHWMGGLFGSNK